MIHCQTSIICVLSALVLTSCSSVSQPDFAPDSVAGRIITLDDRHAQICECPVGSSAWSAWSDFRYGCRFDFLFDSHNQHRKAITPQETTCMTYRKTGACSAEIRYESAECSHTCYLNFTTPTTGTATKKGYSEGSEYKQRNIQFSIK